MYNLIALPIGLLALGALSLRTRQRTSNKTAAIQFINAFNTDDWDTVRQIVAPNFVFHHPVGGTVEAGPEGMVQAWASFKAALPDAWHPIPILIEDGDNLAVLLPTYGTFNGEAYHGIPQTGNWVAYGMINWARFEDGKLAEMWFGMDSLAEMQQMGAAPNLPGRTLNRAEQAALSLLPDGTYDTVTAFGQHVIACGPSQAGDLNTLGERRVDIYRAEGDTLQPVYTHTIAFSFDAPYSGDPDADAENSRTVVADFVERVLNDHNLDALAELAAPMLLVHPTAMPCESTYFGMEGAQHWLGMQWAAFPDLALTECHTLAQGDIVVVRWTAQGTSEGPFLILPATGETISFTGVTMFRVENDRIAEIWDTRNTLGIMGQLNPDLMGGGHGH
jgi:predicted ester cyclase